MIASDYFGSELKRQSALLGTPVLGGTKGGGYRYENGKPQYRKYILRPEDSMNVLYPGIWKDVLKYFDAYGITWWKQNEDRYFPNGHLLSSQNHCLNHLFALRKDKRAVLAIIQSVGKKAGIHFDEVLPSFIDTQDRGGSYICFEFVCENKTLLHENHETRGSKCTSVDALVYARSGNEDWLIPIEWKYTESYDHDPKVENSYSRYFDVIDEGSRLQSWGEFYKVDPFYEFGRQTLLMEKIIKERPGGVSADNFLHIVAIPEGNNLMIGDAEKFKSALAVDRQKLFQIVDSQKLMMPVADLHPDLIRFLSERYWHI